MKRSLESGLFAVCICLGIISSAQGTLVDGWDEWGTKLDPGQSITCIAYFIVNDSYFTQAPIQTDTYLAGGFWEHIGWQSTLSDDNKIAYIYGPSVTNETAAQLGWFSYYLSYQWDDEVVEPEWPVYQDVAVFDGSTLLYSYGSRGTPAGLSSTWAYADLPYYQDEPYENPVPEPTTFLLVGLGLVFLRKKR